MDDAWEKQPSDADDAYTEHELVREEALLEQVDRVAKVDNDFVKMQIQNMNPPPTSTSASVIPHTHEKGGSTTNDTTTISPKWQDQGRRLTEAVRPLPGEPYEHTARIASPGWYRLCIHPATTHINVEMELRKTSTYGKVDPHTGHVPGLDDVEIHSEIRALYSEGGIADYSV